MQLSHMFCFSGFKIKAPKPKSGRYLNWKHYICSTSKHIDINRLELENFIQIKNLKIAAIFILKQNQFKFYSNESNFMKLLNCLAVFLLVLTACEKSNVRDVQRLRTSLMSDPGTLDPRIAYDVIAKELVQLLFSGLYHTNKEGNTTLALADSVSISKDQKTYLFKLKKTKWSDGSKLTAYDFELGWKELLTPQHPASMVDLMFYIKNAKDAKAGKIGIESVGIKALDEDTFQIELEEPVPYFFEVLSHFIFSPVHSSMRGKTLHVDALNAVDFVSCGPFKLKNYAFQKEIQLEKNPEYWNAHEVKLQEIHFDIIKDHQTAFLMFKKGELDWLGSPLSDLPTDEIDELKKQGVLHFNHIAGTKFLIFNTQKFPFNNKNIRKAFSLAIDRQDIIDNITQTHDEPALGFVPKLQKKKYWHPFFKDRDLEEAKKFFALGLKELGLNASEFPKITLSYFSSDLWRKVMQAIQEQWRTALGVQCRLESSEWKVHWESLKSGQYQVGRDGWSCQFNDPMNLLELFKYDEKHNNFSRWLLPNYVALLDASNRVNSTDQRMKLLEEAEQILIEEMPIIPLMHQNGASLQNPLLKDVKVTPLNFVDFRWAYFHHDHSS
jgi:oligopeptide transport system substrate-binding protein